MELKKLIEAMDRIEECGMDEAGVMPPAPTDQGTPVTMNVNLTASGSDHVADLINMMKNAGVGSAPEANADMLPMRMDMERLRDLVDEPEMEAIEEGGMSDKAIEIEEWIKKYETRIGNNGDTLPEGYVKYFMDSGIFSDAYEQNETAKAEKMIGKPYTEWEYDDQEKALEMMPITSAMFDEIEKITGTSGEDAAEMVSDIMNNMDEGYDNEPDPEYQDHKYMTKDLSGGLNREKKAYKAAQPGDNAMAVEAIKAQLMAALTEKKKPDANKNGIPDYAEDGKGPNDLAKGKKGSKPKKGEVPPQFKKK